MSRDDAPRPLDDAGLDDVLSRLARARAEAGQRVEGLLSAPMPEVPRAVLRPVPALRSSAPVAPVDGSPRSAPRSAPRPASRPAASPALPLRSPAGRLLHTVARPVAALVLTAATVLGGWLFVLEPALGSRPVLVRDESMSPSLRTGDVALAVDPDGPLASGTIVAVRLDGRRVVARVIGREELPATADAGRRALAGLIVRADGEPLEVSTPVPLADLVGEVGAAVPRVGLPLVLLTDPATSPLGTLVVVVLLGLTMVGARDLARERRGSSE